MTENNKNAEKSEEQKEEKIEKPQEKIEEKKQHQQEHQQQKQTRKEIPHEKFSFAKWHDKYYKLLLILPALMMLFSIFFLYQFNLEHGDLVLKDVSLEGGTAVTVFTSDFSPEDVKSALISEFPDLSARAISDIRTGRQQAFFVETSSDADKIKTALEAFLGFPLNEENSSIEFSGASLSEGFYNQLKTAMLVAFFFMAVIVFIIFRIPIPSLAVIISAFADIIFTIVVINLLGISISSSGIVALLMLIGYSVDTDIMMTSSILRKREGTLNQRFSGSFKTGMTMTLTSIAAILVALFVIYSFSETLKLLFTILLIGLGFDIFNTWITNASILKWYAHKRGIE